ncbi:MAG: hypothetical protein ACXV3F_07515 [Frankiaceae bacterium]
MPSGVAAGTQAETAAEYRTMQMPCAACLTTSPLDDDRPKHGTVRWEIRPYFALRLGRATAFECPRGHSSAEDPELLKAYPPRRF